MTALLTQNQRLEAPKDADEIPVYKMSPRAGPEFVTWTIVPLSALPFTVNWDSKWFQKVQSLTQLKQGWNGYNAPAPSSLAISRARAFLDALHQLGYPPTRLAASAVGGVGITRRYGGRKAYIEFYNNGAVHALLSDGVSEPRTFPVNPDAKGFLALVTEMKAYLDE